MRKLLVVVLAATILPATLQAQVLTESCTGGPSGCNAVTTVQVVVPAIFSLDLGVETLTLTPPTEDEFGSFVENSGPAITVSANRSWAVTVQAVAANWTYAGDHLGAKPLSDLTWSSTSGGIYEAMTQTAAVVGSGVRTTDASVPMFFRVLYPADPGDPANAAGTYTLGLVFTIAAP
jgi:hypothetical protein